MARVFISYSSADKIFVTNLAKKLKRKKIDVWYAEWEIKVGDSIVEKINQGIISSDCLIIILSNNSVKSKWVNEELSAAMNITIQKGAFILPLLLEDCNIPPLLSHRKYANFKDDSERAFNELVKSITRLRKK